MSRIHVSLLLAARYNRTFILIDIFIFEKIVPLSLPKALLASAILRSTSNPLQVFFIRKFFISK